MLKRDTSTRVDPDRPMKIARRHLDRALHDPPEAPAVEIAVTDLLPAVAPRLASVEILNGDDATELGADAVQFVNLPREDKWVGEHVPNVDRLGRSLRVRVHFDAPGAHRVYLRLRAGAGNVVYSATELTKPEHARDLTEHPYQTGDDGTLIVEGPFVLPSAGGDVYWIDARDDHGTTRSSHRVTTRRLLYLQELVMPDIPASASLDELVATLADCHITLVPVPRAVIPRRRNIDVEDLSAGEKAAFLTDVRAAFAGSAGATKAPYVLVVAYTENLALKRRRLFKIPDVTVGPGQPARRIEVKEGETWRYLWMGINDMPWLTRVHFTPKGGSVTVLPNEICAAHANDHHYPSQCRNIDVQVSEIPAGEGLLEIYAITVRKILGGIAFGSTTPFICVATRTGWIDTPPHKQQAIILHEIGHKLGMVPDGTGTLDRLPLQYSHTHVGSHCHYALPLKEAYTEYEIGRCVMFGEAIAPNRTFCDACKQAMIKAHLGAGWVDDG